MRPGARVQCRPQTLGPQTLFPGRHEEHHPMRTGVVKWIHPKGRFAVVEFEEAGGNVLESFKPFEMQEIVRRKR